MNTSPTPPPTDDLALLIHVATDPVRLLGAKSLPLFEAFKLGYLGALPAGSTFRHLSAPNFAEFITERFPAPDPWPLHLSANDYVRFLGADESTAFDLYVTLRQEYFAGHPRVETHTTISDGSPLDELLANIRVRPRMYFGNDPDLIAALIALFHGAIEAERLHTGASPTADRLNNFGTWLNQRHSWALGRSCHRILRFQNLWNSERALTAFWTYFDLCRAGEPPDALTPVAKQLFETDSALDDMSEAERESYKQKLNQIFYR